ncbi:MULTISPECIES: hypothetical protein [unclassified Mycolicibacterium]|uniref:hypothetical protein n=1 Tax=unclassified Mycolicibacterium TaxID=2636767 RepID=UPI0012DE7EF5|nr:MULTISPECIES: hypothetical protein [unclassified Mycolicibacterium]MUL83142.1 hypothetical protein [Mycolicibacterium sp. CBMA 329]MUL89477.1 hypothetical protein [Mycolicibacterium sp. CBMA 331]MUL99165.1 hypothetical protein [Mycolicibacterium sp. CBMA 334]MUM25727.1 hypothetical protein [Mycolicibacterium sp. CBMA 295]MUM38993.1 hypothetical protein [Mycolicibacterium sp. CBMA 247]
MRTQFVTYRRTFARSPVAQRLGATYDKSGTNFALFSEVADIAWMDCASADPALIEFTSSVSALRAAHPAFRRRRFLDGRAVGEHWETGCGQRVVDDSFLLCFSAHSEPIEFALPTAQFAARWIPAISTSANSATDLIPAGNAVSVDARAVLALQPESD